MPQAGSCCRPRPRPFTLVEILVAMVILIIVVLLAVKFLANLQNAWQHSLGRSNTHEDGRLALGVIARDLESALARTDDQPGHDICFHQPSASEVWFVTDSIADTTVSCPLIEVAYRLRDGRLERAFVDQSCAAWNIYGDRDNASDQGGYMTVIDGVLDLEFVCYDAAMQPLLPSQATHLPAVVCVRLSVMDRRDLRRWQALPTADRPVFEKQACRTFWRTVHTH